MNQINFQRYSDEVFDYLEYIGYPDYVVDFEPEGVAQSLHGSITSFYLLGVSHRMAACAIFGITWEKLKFNINVNRRPVTH